MTPDRLRDASRRRRSADLHQGSAAFRGGVAAARSLAVGEAIAGLFGALGRLQGPLTVAGALGPGPTMDFSGIPTSRRIGPASGATQLRRVPAALPVLRGGSDGDFSKSDPDPVWPRHFPPARFRWRVCLPSAGSESASTAAAGGFWTSDFER